MNKTDALQALLSIQSDDDAFLTKAIKIIAQEYSAQLETADQFKALIVQLIANIDSSLSEQMSLILQHPRYEELEARWRGINNLVSVPFNKQRIKIKCLDFDWQTVSNDVNLSTELKRSQLYNKIGNNELNTLGGEPFGLVLVDHNISAELNDFSEYDDIYTLELLGALGQHCLCPFIMSPDEAFFGESDGSWLSDVNRVKKIIEGPDYSSWQ